jgi:hypothetical protein
VLILANIWGLIYAHWKLALIITITAIVLFLALIQSFCGGDSATEERINERIPEIIEQNAEVNAQTNVVKDAVKESGSRRKELDKVKKRKDTNVSFEQANKARCETFPDSPDCQSRQ